MTPSSGSGRRLRQAQGGARALLVPVALAALLLAGCTSDFLVDGGATAAPDASATDDATPAPTETAPKPMPTQEFDCDDLLIDRPGNYVLGDCGLVTLEGGGIDLEFSSIARLVIDGDGADVEGDVLGDVEIDGQRNDVGAITIGDVAIRGAENGVTAEETIENVVVNGNENVVTAGDSIGSIVDNGLLNEVSQPSGAQG